MARRTRSIDWMPVAVLAVLVGLLLVGLVAALRTVPRGITEGVGSLVAPAEEIDRSGPVIVEAVRDLSELTTVEMVESTTVERGQDRGWLDWAAGDRIFLFAVATISAGVDLSGVDADDVRVDEQANRVTLRLPAPRITAIEVDNDQTRVYDRDTGLFTQGDPDLERTARLAAEELMVDAAVQEGLLERARESTETALVQFLEAAGFDEVEITFDEPDPSRG